MIAWCAFGAAAGSSTEARSTTFVPSAPVAATRIVYLPGGSEATGSTNRSECRPAEKLSFAVRSLRPAGLTSFAETRAGAERVNAIEKTSCAPCFRAFGFESRRTSGAWAFA